MDSPAPPHARVLAHRTVHEGRVVALHVDEVEGPGAGRPTRGGGPQRGSVAALAVDAQGRGLLVRQYRYAVDELLWELPAGRIDPGGTPEQAGGRGLGGG